MLVPLWVYMSLACVPVIQRCKDISPEDKKRQKEEWEAGGRLRGHAALELRHRLACICLCLDETCALRASKIQLSSLVHPSPSSTESFHALRPIQNVMRWPPVSPKVMGEKVFQAFQKAPGVGKESEQNAGKELEWASPYSSFSYRLPVTHSFLSKWDHIQGRRVKRRGPTALCMYVMFVWKGQVSHSDSRGSLTSNKVTEFLRYTCSRSYVYCFPECACALRPYFSSARISKVLQGALTASCLSIYQQLWGNTYSLAHKKWPLTKWKKLCSLLSISAQSQEIPWTHKTKRGPMIN